MLMPISKKNLHNGLMRQQARKKRKQKKKTGDMKVM
jgi:hypothetical protein